MTRLRLPTGVSMSNAESLLPPNANEQERAIEAATARLGEVPVPLADLWNPERCPVSWLPWLAWALSVDEWDSAWSEQTKRDVIATSVDVHRHKGTVGALRKALVAIGYTHVEILERSSYRRDGTYQRDSTINHGDDLPAYQFDVILNVGQIPDAEQVVKISRRIETYKNARSGIRHLKYMNIHHNGLYVRDGSITRNGGIVSG